MNPLDFASAVWRKSTWSGDNGGACVEMAFTGTAVGLRDSKDGGRGPILAFTPEEWDVFIAGVRDGEFDRM